ncbi:MAG TPA: hypothetical protein ACFCUY_03695 [Xenococcaceae cyanobacterium]|jgi:hypothetical protein
MSDLHELLICVSSGLILLILVSGFISTNFIYIEVPLLGRVPLGLVVTVAISLYGCFGLIFLGLEPAIFPEFTLNSGTRLMLGIAATITSYCFGKIMMQLFQETPYRAFSDRAVGLTATVRYTPKLLDTAKPGDALVFDRQEKITQIVTIYLADWAEEKELKTNDLVWIIDYLVDKNAFLVIKTGGVDEFTWQNLLFSSQSSLS